MAPRTVLALALVALLAPVAFASQPITCADKSVTASSIRGLEDIRAFVQCAYEYVMEHGFEESRRAFNEDELWKSGQFYVFVDGLELRGEDSTTFVYPPDPSREGSKWGPFVDDYSSDFFAEAYRLATAFGGGWTYYGITNPETGKSEPKASYVTVIEWDGHPALIGAGIYRRDLPGTCHRSDVNATILAQNPNIDRLREFVRCAAFRVEEQGYFAKGELEGDSRWRDGSIYVFGIDQMGHQFLTGNAFRVNGNAIHEWGGQSIPMDRFGGRDVLGLVRTFGEILLYYNGFNPTAGQFQRKVAFVKQVRAHGVPVLVGSGYYLSE